MDKPTEHGQYCQLSCGFGGNGSRYQLINIRNRIGACRDIGRPPKFEHIENLRKVSGAGGKSINRYRRPVNRLGANEFEPVIDIH